MSRLDRYVLGEMLPPFLFGVGAFLAVLVGTSALYEMLTLIFRQGFPVPLALEVFVFKLPATVVLTFPMAAMFGSLMAISRLSGDGELVALRAGGVSLVRIGLPILVVGLVVSAASLAINELVVPPLNDRAFVLIRNASGTVAGRGDMVFEVRAPDGRFERFLYAETFDPETMTLKKATIVDFTHGEPQTLFAQSVRWQGETWAMEKVRVTQGVGSGSREYYLTAAQWDVGRTPEEVTRVRKRPEEMSLPELHAQAKVALERGDGAVAGRMLQNIQLRLAMPWSSVGFALLGLSLGVRRQRSGRGIGMGLSLVVLFIYYIVAHTLAVLGERSMANHVLIAWTPNLLLYLVGIGLLLRASEG